jgi:hypothetical protein
MYPHNGRGDNRNKAKAISTIPMVLIIVTSGLLSGLLSIISSYQIAIAQQQDTTGGNATTTTGGGGVQSSSACTPTQTGRGGATTGGNATSSTTGGATGGNQSTTSEVRMHIEQACIALQNNDTQGALIELNLALNALGGGSTQGNNVTTATTAGGNATAGGEDGISVGGTSAADDYDETADDDA